MNWHSIYMTALVGGLFGFPSNTHAFCIHHHPRAMNVPTLLIKKKKRLVQLRQSGLPGGGVGWDNQDYLEALSRGPEALQQANDDYNALSRFGLRPNMMSSSSDHAHAESSSDDDDLDLAAAKTDGAQLTEEMKAKMRASHNEEEETTQGGRMFREMMERAKKQGGAMGSAMPPPSPGSIDSLSVEEQARLFRQMMEQQQRQQPAIPPLPPLPTEAAYGGGGGGGMAVPPRETPQMRGGVGPDGRRIGRNRDADAINNSSDVYFAQLKRDSSVRAIHRIQGDTEKANAVFADPDIHKIKTAVNPYLEKNQKDVANLVETAPDEFIDPSFFAPEPPADKSYAGISYKQKLMERKQQKMGNVGTPSSSSSASFSPAPDVAPRQVEAHTEPSRLMQPDTNQISGQYTTFSDERNGGGGATFPSASSSSSSSSQAVQSASGAGGGVYGKYGQDLQVASPTAPAAQPAAVPATTASASGPDPMSTMVSYIDGAYQMYRSSPSSELRSNALMTVRSALEAALTKCQQQQQQAAAAAAAVAPPYQMSGGIRLAPPAAGMMQPEEDRLLSIMTYLDGAYQMYVSSPPELRTAALVTVQTALQAAITKCDQEQQQQTI